MKRFGVRFLSLLLAVLSIGTAFADTISVQSDQNQSETDYIQYLREKIVPDFEQSGFKTKRYRNFPDIAKLRDLLTAYADQMEQNSSDASNAVLRCLKQYDPHADAYAYEFEQKPDWKLLGTLLIIYHEKMTEVLRKNLDFRITYRSGNVCTMVIAFSDINELLWLDNETDWFAAKNAYYYLNTVYDENGSERRPTGFAMPLEKLENLAFPLDAKWYSRIKTTWFRSRDKGVRKHTGMDIRCANGSPVYACEGGVVDSVGYHIKGGYYVSVMDDDGYEYFYYHLKKDSQCVVRGQRVATGEQIGLSGNTGNSAAPHLHLSVITPDHRFVDPFQIYYRWVFLKTGVFVKKPK